MEKQNLEKWYGKNGKLEDAEYEPSEDKKLPLSEYYDEVKARMLYLGLDPYKVVEYVSSDGKNPESVQEGAMPFVANVPSIGKEYNKRYNSKFNPYKKMKNKFLETHQLEEFNEFIKDDGLATQNKTIMDKARYLFDNYQDEKQRPIKDKNITEEEKKQFKKDKEFIQSNLPKGVKNIFSFGAGGSGKESTLKLFDIQKNKNLSTDQQRRLLQKENIQSLSHITSVFFSNKNARAIRDSIMEENLKDQQNNNYDKQDIVINYDTTGMTDTMDRFYPKLKELQKQDNNSSIAFWIYTTPREILKRLYTRQQCNGRAVGADFATFCLNSMYSAHKKILDQLDPMQTYIIDNSKTNGYPKICASIIKDKSENVTIHDLDSFLNFVQSMGNNLMYGTTDECKDSEKYEYKEKYEKERIFLGLKNFCELYGKCTYKNISFSEDNGELKIDNFTKDTHINVYKDKKKNQKVQDILDYIYIRRKTNKTQAIAQWRQKEAFDKIKARKENKNKKPHNIKATSNIKVHL